MDVIKFFENMEPMRYYNNENENEKWHEMVENRGDKFIATVKKDGDWALLLHGENGYNLIRSRSISKVTGKYGDYTAKLPHLVEEMNNWSDNTAVLAEICWDEPHTNANTVGTILRCLPPKAVERQKNKKLKAVMFDLLMLDGQMMLDVPYEGRLQNSFMEKKQTYIYRTEIIYNDFQEAADKVIAAGGEGLVIQRKDNKYWPGTRTAWKTLKLKKSLPLLELKVIGTLEPTKLYDGQDPDNWQFKIDGVAVTKPYYKGWKNGIVVDYKGIETSVASGLTDDDRAWLATTAAQEMINKGSLIAVVKAMQENDLGRLRHASLVRLRTDDEF